MEVIILLVFISVVWVAAALLFLGWQLAKRTHDHTDRVALLPLDTPTDPETTDEHYL